MVVKTVFTAGSYGEPVVMRSPSSVLIGQPVVTMDYRRQLVTPTDSDDGFHFYRRLVLQTDGDITLSPLVLINLTVKVS